MTDEQIQEYFEALQEIVERECFTDDEYQAVMAKVPSEGSLAERYSVLALLADDLMLRPLSDNHRLTNELVAVLLVKALVGGSNSRLVEVLARIAVQQVRVEELRKRVAP